jgi:hypothetical protein
MDQTPELTDKRSNAGNAGDAEHGKLLPMTLLTAIVLPTLLLENDDFFATGLL